MQVRATLTLRHDALLAARERLGMSQAAAADAAEISIANYQRLEKMDFTAWEVVNHAEAVALALDLPRDVILPDGWQGTRSESKHVRQLKFVVPLLASEGQKLLSADPSPMDVATSEELRERILKVMNTLTFREREIIKMRFGIDNDRTYTLEEVGRVFKVTREVIRQIEAKAIRKLQHPVRAAQLEDFIAPAG